MWILNKYIKPIKKTHQVHEVSGLYDYWRMSLSVYIEKEEKKLPR